MFVVAIPPSAVVIIFTGWKLNTQISDLTNDAYEFKEVLVADDFDGSLPEEVFFTEYGSVVTKNAPVSGLGTIGARRTGVGNSLTEITFTPNSGIDIEVKTFMNALRIDENTSLFPAARPVGGESVLDLEQGSITSHEPRYFCLKGGWSRSNSVN